MLELDKLIFQLNCLSADDSHEISVLINKGTS